MSLYQHGMTLKALLQDPNLVNPPKLPTDEQKEKNEEDDFGFLFPGQGAFLGPNLWEKSYDDFKLEYMDLDEFLHENGIPLGSQEAQQAEKQQTLLKQQGLLQQRRASPSTSPKHDLLASSPSHSQSQPDIIVNPHTFSPVKSATSPGASPAHSSSSSSNPGSPKVDFAVSEADLSLAQIPGHDSFDPRRRRFTVDELRPQPMIKKSRKVFVPEDLKDDRYWCRRKKNNIAAKRSRDARRIKENQIALRAAFLERENTQLKEDNDKIKRELKDLKKKLAKFEAMTDIDQSPVKEEATPSNLPSSPTQS